MRQEAGKNASVVCSVLVVESVSPQGAGAQAGLRVGDRLLNYDGQPLPSPFALRALERNIFGQPQIALTVGRDQQETVSVPPGRLDVKTRPDLLPATLTLYEQGRAALQAEQIEQAFRCWSEAARSAAATRPVEAAWLYCRLGEEQAARANWPLAQQAYESAWELAADGADAALRVQIMWELSLCRTYQNDFAEAVRWIERAAEIAEAEGWEMWIALSLHHLGFCADSRRDLAVAEDYYIRALAMEERLDPNCLEVAVLLHNLGVIADSRGDLAVAEDYLTRALTIYERLVPDSTYLPDVLTIMGNVVSRCGDLAAGRDYYTRALAMEERLAPSSILAAIILNNLGVVAELRRDLAVAEDYLTRALAIHERLAPNSLDIALDFKNLGVIAYERGDLAAAHDYQTRALALRERLAPHSLATAESLYELGRLAFRQHHLSQARLTFQRALTLIENQRAQIVSPEARALLMAQHTSKYAALIQTFLALNDRPQAFATFERARARSLLELLAERHLDVHAETPAELREHQTVDQQRARLYSQLSQLSTRQTQQIEALHTQLRALERQRAALMARLRQTSPRYAALQYPEPLNLEAAQAVLDAGTLLLAYLVDEEQTFLFALTRTDLEILTLPLGREALQEQVRAFREALDVRLLDYSLSQALAQGKALYDRLLLPVQGRVKKAKRLLLCPDGALQALPFAALVSREGRTPRYLGEQKSLHQIASMTVYAQTRQQAPAPAARRSSGRSLATSLSQAARLLVLGDPVYVRPTRAQTCVPGSARSARLAPSGASLPANPDLAQLCLRGLSLRPLPHTRQEVEDIAHLFGERAQICLGKSATKTAALQASGAADILHFACHGWLDHQWPLCSGLVLSQPDALGQPALEGDNGLLQAWEIFEQIRLKAELVVLSVCQSGLGQEVRGEGLIGLTRAFQYAGARSLVVSLWEINDASTAAFMQAFYAALKAGASKDAALLRAMRTLRQDPRWHHPYYWSAFLLVGDWR